MPMLSDENFPDWLDYVIVYGRVAGWGQDDAPEVYSDETHESTKIAREIFYNKLSVLYKQRVKIVGILAQLSELLCML